MHCKICDKKIDTGYRVQFGKCKRRKFRPRRSKHYCKICFQGKTIL